VTPASMQRLRQVTCRALAARLLLQPVQCDLDSVPKREFHLNRIPDFRTLMARTNAVASFGRRYLFGFARGLRRHFDLADRAGTTQHANLDSGDVGGPRAPAVSSPFSSSPAADAQNARQSSAKSTGLASAPSSSSSVPLSTIVRMLQAFRHSLERVEKHYAKTLNLPPEESIITPLTLPKILGAVSLVTAKHSRDKQEAARRAAAEEQLRAARGYTDPSSVPLWMVRRFLHFSPIAHAAYRLNAQDFVERCARESVRVTVLHAQAYGDFDKRPPFFVVKDEASNDLVVSFRGTQNFEDIITDLISWPVPFIDSYAHHGMSQAAIFLYDSLLDAIAQAMEKAWIPKAENPDVDTNDKLTPKAKMYHRLLSSDTPWPRVIFTGHSLGAGIAVCAALLCHTPTLGTYPGEPHNSPANELEAILRSAFANRLAPECLLFAAPACLSPELSLRTHTFAKSIVLGDDLVPRLSEFTMAQLILELYEAAAANKKNTAAHEQSTQFGMDLSQIDNLREAADAVEKLTKLPLDQVEAISQLLERARVKVDDIAERCKQVEEYVSKQASELAIKDAEVIEKNFQSLKIALDEIETNIRKQWKLPVADPTSTHPPLRPESMSETVRLLLRTFQEAAKDNREMHLERKKENELRIQTVQEQVKANLEELSSTPAGFQVLVQLKQILTQWLSAIPLGKFGLTPAQVQFVQNVFESTVSKAKNVIQVHLSDSFSKVLDKLKIISSITSKPTSLEGSADTGQSVSSKGKSWWSIGFEEGISKVLSSVGSSIPALEREKFAEALDLTLLVLPCDIYHIERLAPSDDLETLQTTQPSKQSSTPSPTATTTAGNSPKGSDIVSRPVIVGNEQFDCYETWLKDLDDGLSSTPSSTAHRARSSSASLRRPPAKSKLNPIKSLLPSAVNSTIDAIVISPEQQFRIVRKSHFGPFTSIVLSENTVWDHAMKRLRLALMNILQHGMTEQREVESRNNASEGNDRTKVD